MLWILIAAAVCAGDLLVKHYIDTHKEENCYEPVVGGHIIITRFHNPGAMLGWMKDKPKMLMGVTILGIGVLAGGLMGSLYKKKSVLIRLGLALLLGGAASNAYDRIMKKEVQTISESALDRSGWSGLSSISEIWLFLLAVF